MKAKSRILILLSWIHDILLLEGVHVFAAAVQNIRGHELSVFLLRGLTMLVSVILSYFIICKCKNLWLFLVFSLAVTWGMWVVSRSIFIGSLTALVFLFRCYVKLKQGEIRRRGDSMAQFHIGYYLFAILFLMFDVETVFLFPWAVKMRELGVDGLLSIAVFFGVLVLGLVYAWRKGALEWK